MANFVTAIPGHGIDIDQGARQARQRRLCPDATWARAGADSERSKENRARRGAPCFCGHIAGLPWLAWRLALKLDGRMAKAFWPLCATAGPAFEPVFGCELKDNTLPVPISGSNDWANAGAPIAVRKAKAVRSFFILVLPWFVTVREKIGNGGSLFRKPTAGALTSDNVFMNAA
jgi:hypothetical protein